MFYKLVMKLLSVLLLTALLYGSSEPASMYAKSVKHKKPTVSLVLGSGGARGYAHIGVIEALKENGYEIKSISGSSMGALIGGLYAAGGLEAYRQWVLNLDTLEVLEMIDFSFDGGGLIDAEKVYAKIGTFIGDVKIEDLPITYTAVASDVENRKKVWFKKGKLIDAIRASVAIPTVFTPVVKDDMLLVDGGVLSPLPLEAVASDKTDLVIAVNLNANIPPESYEVHISKERQEKQDALYSEVMKYYNEALKVIGGEEAQKKEIDIFYVLSRTLDAAQGIITKHDIATYKPDIVIEIPRESCESYEFDKAYKMIEIGKMATQKSLKERGKRWKRN